MVRAIIFGLGLVSSYIVLGLCLLSFRKSISSLEGFSYIIGVIIIFIGLNLMGILKSPVALDNYFHNSARRYAGTLGGIFFLGILFSFVKVPCTAPMLLVLLNKIITSGTANNLILLLAFSAGVLTPFIGIGLIGGYTLSKQIRSYKIYLKKNQWICAYITWFMDNVLSLILKTSQIITNVFKIISFTIFKKE